MCGGKHDVDGHKETLVIRRALEAAAGSVGGGAAGLRAARALLGALVLSDSAVRPECDPDTT